MDLHPSLDIIDSSKLKDYTKCPRYFLYSHVLGWKSEFPNNHLIFGSAWHEAMEHLLLNGYEEDSVHEAFDKFLIYYRQYFLPETDEMFKGKTPANVLMTIPAYIERWIKEDYEEKPYEVLYTEIAGSVPITESDVIYFRMDSILKDLKKERVYSREHKTGSRVWMWAEQWPLAIATGTYNHVLYCLYPYEVSNGIQMNGTFFLTRKNNPWDFLRFTIKKTKDQMQTWFSNINFYYFDMKRELDLLMKTYDRDLLEAFPLRTNNCLDYSRVCEYHDYCLAWPNPIIRSSGQPPPGFKIEYWNPMEKEAKQTFDFKKGDLKI